MPDDQHPTVREDVLAINDHASIDGHTDLGKLPPPSGHPGHTRLRTAVAVGALIAAAGLGFRAYDSLTTAPTMAAPLSPPSVVVAAPVQANVANRTDLTGQFSAVNQVVLLAQVSGYLTEIRFEDGQIVHKGDLLFVIDSRPYEIQLEQATAQFQTASATLALANKQIDRSARLKAIAAASVTSFPSASTMQAARSLSHWRRSASRPDCSAFGRLARKDA